MKGIKLKAYRNGLFFALCILLVTGCATKTNSNLSQGKSEKKETAIEEQDTTKKTTKPEKEEQTTKKKDKGKETDKNKETEKHKDKHEDKQEDIISPLVMENKDITYKEYKKKYGDDAEFYHYCYFWGRIPDTDINLEFWANGENDDYTRYLLDDDCCEYVKGYMEDIFPNLSYPLTLDEFENILEEQGCVVEIERWLEGAGTIYYIGDYYTNVFINLCDEEETFVQLKLCNNAYEAPEISTKYSEEEIWEKTWVWLD